MIISKQALIGVGFWSVAADSIVTTQNIQLNVLLDLGESDVNVLC